MRITIYSDDKLLMDTNLENITLVAPKTKQEVNKAGSLTFTIYPNHPHFDFITKMKSIITVYEEGLSEPLFRGRVYDEAQGFHNEKQVSCEGELAFFNDSIIRPYEFKGTPADLFTMYVTTHNSQVDASRQFIVGNITVTDANEYIVRSNSEYTNTWTEMNNKLLKLLGGYLWIRHEGGINYIDYLEDFDVLSNQSIDFGKNLLDLKKNIKVEKFATALIPLGARLKDEQGQETGERLTIKSVNDDIDYVFNEDAVAEHGYIFTTNIWDDVTDATNLKRKGQAWIDDSAQFVASITVSAADLHGATIEGEPINVNSFRIGRYVKVNTAPHSLVNQKFIVSKLDRDLLNPEKTKLVLGTTYKSLTEMQSEYKVLKGDTGAAGKDGKGIAGTAITYQASTSGTVTPTGEWQTAIPTVAANQYLWTRTVITYTDNTTSTMYTIGKMGTNGKDGATGVSVATVTNYYLATASSSGVTTTTSGWTTVIQNVTSSKKYLWNYEVIKGSDGSTLSTTAPCIIGAYGDKGATGNGISSIVEYYAVSNSNTTAPASWSTTLVNTTTSNKYLWNYEKITYTDGTSKETIKRVIGTHGATGANGKDAAIQSDTAPTDTSYMWLDTSVEPPLLKRWNGEVWVIVNDQSDAIQLLEQRFTADIQTTERNITQTLTESYYTKGDTEALVSSKSAEWEQTASGFTMQFTELSKELSDVSSNADTRFQEISKYIRFEDGNIVLGEAGNPLTLKVENDRISFIQNNTEVAYFSDNKLYVTDGEFISSMQVGSFAFIPRTNGNLSFKKIN